VAHGALIKFFGRRSVHVISYLLGLGIELKFKLKSLLAGVPDGGRWSLCEVPARWPLPKTTVALARAILEDIGVAADGAAVTLRVFARHVGSSGRR
jgi:hypothetical protein